MNRVELLVGVDHVFERIGNIALYDRFVAVVLSRAEICAHKHGASLDVACNRAFVLNELVVVDRFESKIVLFLRKRIFNLKSCYRNVDCDVFARLLSCKVAACNHFEQIGVPCDNSAVGDVDGYACACRAVVNLILDVEVVDDELDLLFAHVHGVDKFEIVDCAHLQGVDLVVLVVDFAVSRTFENVVFEDVGIRAVESDFESADKDVVFAVCADVFILCAFQREHKGNFACVVGEFFEFFFEVGCVLYGRKRAVDVVHNHV